MKSRIAIIMIAALIVTACGDTSDLNGPATVKGSISVSNTITCGASSVDDCKGTLYVGVVDKPVAPPQSTLLGSKTIANVDLTVGSVSYEISELIGESLMCVSAMLSETGHLSNPPFPQTGDLVIEPKPIQLVTGSSNVVDLALDARWK